MATPPSSITTVKGRRCTRSRARTATTSPISTPIAPQPSPLEQPLLAPQAAPVPPVPQAPQEPSLSFVVFSGFPTSTPIQQAPRIQTSIAGPSSAPAPSPSTSNVSTDPSPAAPTTNISTTSTTDATSAQATIAPTSNAPVTSETSMTTLPPSTSEQPTSLSSTEPTVAGTAQPTNVPSSLVVSSSPIVIVTSTSPSPTSSTLVSSDTLAVAVPTFRSDTSSVTPEISTGSVLFVSQSSFDVAPQQPSQTNRIPLPSLLTSVAEQPQQTTPTAMPIQSGAPAIIAPDQGSGSNTALAQHNNSHAHVGSLVGRIIGGIAGFALLSCLIFLFLRKRKSRTSTWDEKKNVDSSFAEKLTRVRTGIDVLFAKAKGRKAGPMGNPYQRHTAQMSVSSTYSVHSNNRGRSISESQAAFAVQRQGPINPNQQGRRSLVHKKTDSVSLNYRFPGTGEDSSLQNQHPDLAPYADQEPSRNLQLLNPDPNSRPITPQPAIASDRLSRDAFSLLLDQIEDVPDWLRDTSPNPSQKRTQNPTSQSQEDNPFRDPSDTPSMPTQAVFSGQRRRSSVAYPAYNPTSTSASRESQFTFFGEPGPSRPGTNLFTPGLFTGRTVRQSDPFDLDRPEVLGLGNVSGNRQLASVTRLPTRGRRTSSVADGPYRL